MTSATHPAHSKNGSIPNYRTWSSMRTHSGRRVQVGPSEKLGRMVPAAHWNQRDGLADLGNPLGTLKTRRGFTRKIYGGKNSTKWTTATAWEVFIHFPKHRNSGVLVVRTRGSDDGSTSIWAWQPQPSRISFCF